MPRPSSPLSAKASVRSPYALDRSQQNSCVGTEAAATRRDRGVQQRALASYLPDDVFSESVLQAPGKAGLNPSIHDVRSHAPVIATASGNSLLSAIARAPRGEWWSQTGSNRRPHACKARALPTELWPLDEAAASLRELSISIVRAPRCSHEEVWWAQADSNCRPHAYQACALTN